MENFFCKLIMFQKYFVNLEGCNCRKIRVRFKRSSGYLEAAQTLFIGSTVLPFPAEDLFKSSKLLEDLCGTGFCLMAPGSDLK